MNSADERLTEILGASRTVAAAGLSEKPWRPSHQITVYLQGAGFRVIPVNPHIGETLGERACPSLAAAAHPVDIVDVFRRAGIEVTEDLCIKPAHARLVAARGAE